MLVYPIVKYLLHYDGHGSLGRLVIKLVALVSIFFVSALNYRFFEAPIMRLRNRFAPEHLPEQRIALGPT